MKLFFSFARTGLGCSNVPMHTQAIGPRVEWRKTTYKFKRSRRKFGPIWRAGWVSKGWKEALRGEAAAWLAGWLPGWLRWEAGGGRWEVAGWLAGWLARFHKMGQMRGAATSAFTHSSPYYTILHYTIPYQNIPYYTILHHTIPYPNIPYFTMLYHTIS